MSISEKSVPAPFVLIEATPEQVVLHELLGGLVVFEFQAAEIVSHVLIGVANFYSNFPFSFGFTFCLASDWILQGVRLGLHRPQRRLQPLLS